MNNKMSAHEKKLSDIFSKEFRKYNIPNYQRAYSWSKIQTEELFDDLIEAFSSGNGDNEYFLGSIITIIDQEESSYDIIDGQQRLITLSLFFLSLKNYFISDNNRKYCKNKLKVIHELEERLTNNSIGSNKNDTKIKVRTIDQQFYDNLIFEDFQNCIEDSDSKRRMLSNYEIFNEKLIDLNFNEENMLNFYIFLITKVSIVLISTTNIASSFRIFDVLNSRGLPLTRIDLLKSKIFEKVFLCYPERNNELEQQWLTLEELIGIDNLNGFYNTHCLSKLERNDLLFSKASDKYEEKLNNDPNFQHNPISIVGELKKSAQNYLSIFNSDMGDPELNQSLHVLSFINKSSRTNSKNSNYSMWVPPLLALKNRMDDYNDISKADFKEFLKIYEVFFIQMLLLRYNKAQIQSAYGNLVAAINKLELYSSIKNILLKMLKNNDIEENINKEFKIKTASVSQTIKGLLLRLNFDKSDEIFSINFDDITLEHVLPQNIKTNYWKEHYNDIDHNQWLNRLGNFALLKKSKNSSARNNDFNTKKEAYTKDTNSIFPLTREIALFNDWGINDINKRHKELTSIAKRFLLKYQP